MRRKTWWRTAGRASVAALIASAGLCASCTEQPETTQPIRPIRVMRVGDVTEFTGRRFPGRAEAHETAELSFRVPGRLQELPVRIGEVVEAGTVVARLDPRDFEVQVSRRESSLAVARAELALAEEELERVESAFGRAGVSAFEVSRARAARDVRAANVGVMEAELESARDSLSDTTLRAPIAGEITQRFVENFEDVQAKQRLLRIVDDSKIEVRVFVPEQLMVLLPLVEEIRCVFDAHPGVEFVAAISEIGREADEATRTFPITLIMTQHEGARVLPGMTGHAWVSRLNEIREAEQGYILPTAAIGEGADGSRFVWGVEESSGTVRRLPVEVGPLAPGGVRVRGIAPGTLVASAGASFLHEGQRVRLPGEPVDEAGDESGGEG